MGNKLIYNVENVKRVRLPKFIRIRIIKQMERCTGT